jgi:hypothetical protein
MIARHLLIGVALAGFACPAMARDDDREVSGVVVTAADGTVVADDTQPVRRAVRARRKVAGPVATLPPARPEADGASAEAAPAVSTEPTAPIAAAAPSSETPVVVANAVLPPLRATESDVSVSQSASVAEENAPRIVATVLPPARPEGQAEATSEPRADEAATETGAESRTVRIAALPPARPAFPSDDPVQTGSLAEPTPAPAPQQSLFGSLFGGLPSLPTPPAIVSGAGTGHNGIDGMITRHAQLNDVPESLVHRVVIRESKYNPRAIGKGGALGLMQIKHATARSMGFDGPANGLLDANTNLTYAVKYLAGAYRLADGNHDQAVAYYARGYYYAAKNKGVRLASSSRGRHKRVREASAQDGDVGTAALLATAPSERTTAIT